MDKAALPSIADKGNDAKRRDSIKVFIADLHLDGTDSPRALAFRLLLRRLAAESAGGLRGDSGVVWVSRHKEPDEVLVSSPAPEKRKPGRPVDVYFLGDLFAFWYEYRRAIFTLFTKDIAALRLAADAGVRIHLVFGNRDFAYDRFAENEWKATLLGDGTAIVLSDGRRAWLEHGDLLCPNDARYLRYRKFIRSFPIRLLFRLLPWSAAQRLIESLRKKTEADKRRKTPETFTLSLDAARKRMEEKNCTVLLCGHLHKPLRALASPGHEVWVLPAWLEGGYALRDADGLLTPLAQEQPPKRLGECI
jgi:UDP-2,3-diacylglucosamine hydrolase